MTHQLLHILVAACLAGSLSTCCQVQRLCTQQPAEKSAYWITASSGKTHNSSCRYFLRGKGSLAIFPSGDNCKHCGGAEKR